MENEHKRLSSEIERVEIQLEKARRENLKWPAKTNNATNKDLTAMLIRSLEEKLQDLNEQKRKLNP